MLYASKRTIKAGRVSALDTTASRTIENARLYAVEQQARAARKQAQAANRIKDEFLAVLSHELRSPLNPILAWSSLLQTRKPSGEKMTQALATIQRNAKLQSQLIENLLDVFIRNNGLPEVVMVL